MNNLTYRELAELVERNPYIKTRTDAVGYLIGRNGSVDRLDLEYILRLCEEGIIAE